MIIHGGVYSTKAGKTAAAFSSGSYSLGPSRINQWQRVSYTFTLDAEIDLTKPISFYIYGYSGAEGIAHVKNISFSIRDERLMGALTGRHRERCSRC